MTPYSPFSPGPPLHAGRELTQAEEAALIRRRRRTRAVVVAAACGAVLAVFAWATRQRERVLDREVADYSYHADARPPPPYVPDYSPAGVDAALKRQGGAGIDRRNAMAKAQALEAAIDAEITEREALTGARVRLAKLIAARRVQELRAMQALDVCDPRFDIDVALAGLGAHGLGYKSERMELARRRARCNWRGMPDVPFTSLGVSTGD